MDKVTECVDKKFPDLFIVSGYKNESGESNFWL